MNHPRIFINFVLVTSPLNPSLRPHIHRSVHLTVTLNKQSNLKKVFKFLSSLPIVICAGCPVLYQSFLFVENSTFASILKAIGWYFPQGQKNNRFPDVSGLPTTTIAYQKKKRYVPPCGSLSASYSHIQNSLRTNKTKRLLHCSFKQFERHMSDS